MSTKFVSYALLTSALTLTGCYSQDGDALPSQVIYKNANIQILPADNQGNQALARVYVKMNNKQPIQSDTLDIAVSDNHQTQQQGEQYQGISIPDNSPIYTFSYWLFSGAYSTQFSLYGDYYNQQQVFSISISNDVFSNLSSEITYQGAPSFITDIGSKDFLPSDTISLEWQNTTDLTVNTAWLTGCNNKERIKFDGASPLTINLSDFVLTQDMNAQPNSESDSCELAIYLTGNKEVAVSDDFAGGDINLEVFSLPAITKVILE